MVKMFSETLFNENDAVARQAALKYLNGIKGYSFIENPNKYDTDLISGNIGVEVERRSKWHGGNFPYAFVNIPFRKLKQFGGNHPLQNHFIVFNAECSQLVYISSKTLLEYCQAENAVEIWADVKGQGWMLEKFFRIPLDRCKVIDITANDNN